MVHTLSTSHDATSKKKSSRRSAPILVNSAHKSVTFSRVGSNVGTIGAISLALDYLFVVENNTHILSKSKEVMSTTH